MTLFDSKLTSSIEPFLDENLFDSNFTSSIEPFLDENLFDQAMEFKFDNMTVYKSSRIF